jgi:hypothetical protein
MGLNCRPMGGFDKNLTQAYFQIPESHTPVVMIAIGFQGNIDSLSKEVQKKNNSSITA